MLHKIIFSKDSALITCKYIHLNIIALCMVGLFNLLLFLHGSQLRDQSEYGALVKQVK